jgi:antagonist of KipI
MSLRILEAGLQSRLVDFGRPGSRSLGVPVGGAADRWSLALGNALAGNRPDAPALEVAFAGPTLRAESEVAGVLFGAPFDIRSDRQLLAAGKSFTLLTGELLRIGGTPRGARAYLCVAGGFDAPPILGSRSALEPIRVDQVLQCWSGSLPPRFLDASANVSLPTAMPQAIRVLPGAQADWFDLALLASRIFTVSPASDRMGLRLKGEALQRPEREMISEPVCPGAIQVTNDGQCIVLGVDGQTIGGYPKIAQVIRADLDFLGQLRPGDTIRFGPVSLSHAEDAYLLRLGELRRWLARIATATDCSGVAEFSWL